MYNLDLEKQELDNKVMSIRPSPFPAVVEQSLHTCITHLARF